ncbi:hypothetical protein N9A45_00670 [bacterium]|nr:hypothetical protein [bacterium]
MYTHPIGHVTLHCNDIMASKSADEPRAPGKVELSDKETLLVRWEEWALSTEEHFHALELWQRRPNGAPMGHHR